MPTKPELRARLVALGLELMMLGRVVEETEEEYWRRWYGEEAELIAWEAREIRRVLWPWLG